MRRHLVLLIAVLVVSIAAPAPAAAAARPAEAPTSRPTTAAHSPLATLPEPTATGEGLSNVDSRLAQVIASGKAQGEVAGVAKAQAVGLPVSVGNIRVIVETSDEASARAGISAAGAKIERSAAGLLQVLASPTQLAQIAASPAVSYVRPPMTHRAVAVQGEGVGVTNALRLQAMAGVTGAGVKIAVIDLGFKDYTVAQASGDLPASLTTVDYCGGTLDLYENHGTAVSEIVHEMAPDAQLYLICVGTEVELAAAEVYAKQHGITVVNHSVGWLGTSRGDGKGGAGTPDATVADAAANGILWVNSAGNYATEHWGGRYTDYLNNGYHWNKFASSPLDLTNAFYLQAGQEACAVLKWDAWPRTKQDFDLYIGDWDTGDFVAGSVNRQYPNNLAPEEDACYTNTSLSGAWYYVAINRYNASTSPWMDLYLLDSDLYYQTAAGSIVEPASSPNAFAVGAVAYSSTSIEPFSSRGPTIDNRIKPDISGPDGVSGTTYGVHAFYGTSASSPHLAGAAALVKSMYPGYSLKQIRSYLQSSATDLGSSGPDNTFGSGMVHLPGPPAAPTGGTATPYHQSVLVGWTAPTDNGGSTVSGYLVTASPGGATCRTSSATSCTVTGLDDGTPYSFTVVAVNAVGTGDASSPTTEVTPLGVPSAPVVSASFDGSHINVTWTAADGHGSAITDYAVSVTGFADCHTTELFCQFGPATSSFTGSIVVVASNSVGAGPAGRLTFAARAGDSYVPLLPSRVLDTAQSKGSILAPAVMGKLTSLVPVEFQVTGQSPTDPDRNVPAGAVAVTAELEVWNATYPGYLSLTPARVTNARTSNLNFRARDSRAAGVTVPLSPSGTLWVIYGSKSGQKTDAALDITGYFVAGADGATYHALTPNRIVDSRPTNGDIVNTGMYTPVIRGVSRTFKVTDRVPSDATVNVPAGSVAVVGNLTVTNQTAPGFFSLAACPDLTPDTGTLYFPKGDNRASGVTALIAPDGTLSITFTSSTADATADVIFDISGYYSPEANGALFVPLTPYRLLDSRIKVGFKGPMYTFRAYTFQAIGRTPSDPTTNVPANAVAVTGTLTVTLQSYGGYLSLTTDPVNVPTTSTLNFPTKDDRANGATLPLSSTGKLSVTYGALGTNHTHAIFDVTGYFVN